MDEDMYGIIHICSSQIVKKKTIGLLKKKKTPFQLTTYSMLLKIKSINRRNDLPKTKSEREPQMSCLTFVSSCLIKRRKVVSFENFVYEKV